MTVKKTVETGLVLREASITTSTVNEEKRTVDVVFSTGSRGHRFSWSRGTYYEEIEVSESAMRMDRLDRGGVPVLNSHSNWELRDVIGVVERAWIEDGKALATLRMSDRDDVEGIWRDIKGGILRNVSVGYNVHKYEVETREGEELETYRAVDWEPMEISFVPIGFDPGAQTRSQSSTVETSIVQRGTTNMTTPNKDKPAEGVEVKRSADVEQEKPTVDTAAIEKRSLEAGMKAERKRIAEIEMICRTGKLDDAFKNKMIEDGVPVDEARKLAFDKLAEADERTDTRSAIRVEAGAQDEIKTMRSAVETSILHRVDPVKYASNESAERYRGMRLLEMVRTVLATRGVSTYGLSPMELAARAFHSTSDFPEILANVANKTLRDAYAAAPQTWLPLVRIVSVSDFKQISRVQLGDAPQLEEVLEDGEYQYGTVGEAAEKYSIATYGKIVAVTRKTLVNDDLDAFTRMPMMFARAAADKISDLVWAQITSNPTMGDGVALFHATHNNLGNTGVISDTTLAEAREDMRKQTGLNGSYLNLVPKYIAVPAGEETTAAKWLETQAREYATSSSNVNTFRGSLEIIVEPRLDAADADAYYLFADRSQIDLIELAFLDGKQGPTLEQDVDFDTDGMKMKVSLDCGAKVIDWRGMYKNEGA